MDGPGAARAVCMALLGVVVGGCSILLDTSTQQCQSNSDCARFPNAVCDVSNHLCTPRLPSSLGSDGSAGPEVGGAPACHDESGCLPCPGGAPPTLLEACTSARCVPFDNKARLANLQADGGLKPLPP